MAQSFTEALSIKKPCKPSELQQPCCSSALLTLLVLVSRHTASLDPVIFILLISTHFAYFYPFGYSLVHLHHVPILILVIHCAIWALLVMQVMPALSCFASIIWTADLFYAVGSAQGLQVMTWSPQGVVILLLAIGTASCIGTCLLIPCMMDRLKTRGPNVLPIKRINLLGLVSTVVMCILCCLQLRQCLPVLLAERWTATNCALLR